MAMVPWSGPWSVKTVAFLSALLRACFPKQFHCRLPPPWLSKLYSVRFKLQHDYIPESWLTLKNRISKNVKILHYYNTNSTRHYCWTTQLNTSPWKKTAGRTPPMNGQQWLHCQAFKCNCQLSTVTRELSFRCNCQASMPCSVILRASPLPT